MARRHKGQSRAYATYGVRYCRSMDVRASVGFEACRNRRDGGWCVEVTWPSGARTIVRYFATEQEALDWIAVEAETWLHGPNLNRDATGEESE